MRGFKTGAEMLKVCASLLFQTPSPAPCVQTQDRPALIRKAQKRLASTFNMTKFAGVAMVPVTAKPGERGVWHGIGQPLSLLLSPQQHIEIIYGGQQRVGAGPLPFVVEEL